MDFQRILARIRVHATKLGRRSEPLFNLSALVVGLHDSENVTGASTCGHVGLLSRPKPPDDSGACTGFAARIEDSLVAFALKDDRIAQAIGALPDLAIALGGYLGQRVVLDSSGVGKVTIAHGAMSIVLDATPAPTPTISLTLGATSITLDGTTVKITGAVTVNGVPLNVP